MDSQHFDALAKSLTEAGTRRGLLGLFASLPVLGGLLALVDLDDGNAQGRRKRRKKRHKHGKGRHRRKRCKTKSKAKVCAGRCGPVRNNCNLQKSVNCGSCPTGQCCSGKGTCGACLVFATSDEYDGNLGGLAGADALCQGLADEAKLPGEYLAWLSDDSGSPSTRFVQATVPYIRTDGVIVANDWADLLTVPLAASISRDESGATVGGSVWTNTTITGTRKDNQLDCAGWTDGTDTLRGGLGTVDTNSLWTDSGFIVCDAPFLRLYCFQQS